MFSWCKEDFFILWEYSCNCWKRIKFVSSSYYQSISLNWYLIMSSYCVQVIKKLCSIHDVSQKIFITRVASGNSTDSDNNNNEEAFQLNYLSACIELEHVINSWYAGKRGKYRKSALDVFQQDLDDSDGCWLTQEEFKHKYHIDKESLDIITEMIKGHDVFQKQTNAGWQVPVKHQLMVLLNSLGTECSNNNSQRNVFLFCRGTSCLYCNWCVKALTSLCNEYIKRPNEEERKKISERILKKFGILNCVGIMDGTLLVGLKPSCDDAANYHGRKLPFSLTVLFIYDGKRRISYCLAGFPGSTHDNRVWRNSNVNQLSNEHFNDVQ